MNYKLSVIVPAYNAESTVAACLNSVLLQTTPETEIIVVDDGSTDRTAKVVDDYAKTCGRTIRYFHQENAGPAAARNKGISISSGALIAFLDADDEWLPNHIQRGIEFLDANPSVIWFYGSTRIVNNSSSRVINPNVLASIDGLIQNSIPIDGFDEFYQIDPLHGLQLALTSHIGAGFQPSIIRRQLFEKIKIPDFRVGEDQLLTILALSRGIKIAFCLKLSVCYYTNPNSISAMSKSGLTAIRPNETLAMALRSQLSNSLLDKSNQKLLKYRISKIHFWLIGYRYFELGNMEKANKNFREGILLNPTSIRFWKTYLFFLIRWLLR